MTKIQSTIVLGLLVILAGSGSYAQDCVDRCVNVCTAVRDACDLGDDVCNKAFGACESDCNAVCSCLEGCPAGCEASFQQCTATPRFLGPVVCFVQRETCPALCGAQCAAAVVVQASGRIRPFLNSLYSSFVVQARIRASQVLDALNTEINEFVSPEGFGGQAQAIAERFIQRVVQSATDNGNAAVQVAIASEGQAETAVRADIAAIRAALLDARDNTVNAETAVANQLQTSGAALLAEFMAAQTDATNEIAAAAEANNISLRRQRRQRRRNNRNANAGGDER